MSSRFSALTGLACGLTGQLQRVKFREFKRDGPNLYMHRMGLLYYPVDAPVSVLVARLGASQPSTLNHQIMSHPSYRNCSRWDH